MVQSLLRSIILLRQTPVITTPFGFNPVELLDLMAQGFVTNNIRSKFNMMIIQFVDDISLSTVATFISKKLDPRDS